MRGRCRAFDRFLRIPLYLGGRVTRSGESNQLLARKGAPRQIPLRLAPVSREPGPPQPRIRESGESDAEKHGLIPGEFGVGTLSRVTSRQM